MRVEVLPTASLTDCDVREARLNVGADGKRFRCDFIREGPVFYPEIQKGIEVLRRRTIQAGLSSYVGKPLTVEHIDPRLNVADAEVFKRVAIGVVDKTGYDPEEGWFFCEGDIFTEEGAKLARTLNPSCGYVVNSTGAGGRWNNVPYERELTAIEFHHLALTKHRPRYEEADFRLNAATNPNGETTMFKFLKKLIPAGAPAGTAATITEEEIPASTVIKTASGKEFRLNDVLAAAEEAATVAVGGGEPKVVTSPDPKAADMKEPVAGDTKTAGELAAEAAAAGRINAITDDTIVVVAGRKVTVKQVVAAHEARQNAAQVAAGKAAEGRANAAEGEGDFRKLQNAAGNAANKENYSKTAGTQAENLKRGNY